MTVFATARGCPFCRRHWDQLDVLDSVSTDRDDYAIIRPLHPVTEGHLLVIPGMHFDSAHACPWSAGEAVEVAARYIREELDSDANIITSIGPAATQTVFHLHVHIVPRRPDDGLTLPWTGQIKD
ncbi:histidine triad nucleotide binding protein [Gordonia phage Skog]|uniref:Histidine triad nucleotide binding protein n=1 Tax=Gordonia phage Skog TaxID=2704033 RepID=A0A6G6XJU3_9CAUD|nr:histidine triad nucleotide binding protein [Gordonia phage Skog]QIG58296.1 histidine triad nucleotide binding protein [Gordonia phage Skog]